MQLASQRRSPGCTVPQKVQTAYTLSFDNGMRHGPSHFTWSRGVQRTWITKGSNNCNFSHVQTCHKPSIAPASVPRSSEPATVRQQKPTQGPHWRSGALSALLTEVRANLLIAKGAGEGEAKQKAANPKKLRQRNYNHPITQLSVSCPQINYVTYNLQTHLPA